MNTAPDKTSLPTGGSNMRRFARHGAVGVTLTELLVVLAIVGLLATISVPAVLSRSTQAKFAAARAECKSIAQGEEACAMLHGFYVPIQILDNLPHFDAQNPSRDDTITNESFSTVLIYADISSRDQTFSNPAQPSINDTQRPRVAKLLQEWGGPFVNFQKTYLSGSNPSSNIPPPPSPNLVRQDYPLDPWGNPYRLYSPQGITGSSAGTGNTPVTESDMAQPNFSDGRLSNIDDRFDRYAIVSFGPNGTSDGTQITFGSGSIAEPTYGDDIIYFFGAEPRDIETTFGGVIVSPTP